MVVVAVAPSSEGVIVAELFVSEEGVVLSSAPPPEPVAFAVLVIVVVSGMTGIRFVVGVVLELVASGEGLGPHSVPPSDPVSVSLIVFPVEGGVLGVTVRMLLLVRVLDVVGLVHHGLFNVKVGIYFLKDPPSLRLLLMMQFILDMEFYQFIRQQCESQRIARFRCSAVMVVCILPGLSTMVSNSMPLIRCRTVAWSWLEGGLICFLQSTP